MINRFEFKGGGYPLTIEVFEAMKQNMISFDALCKGFGDNLILSGVEDDGKGLNGMTEGYVIYNKQLYYVKAGTKASRLTEVVKDVVATYDDNVDKTTWQEHTLEWTDNLGGVLFTSFARITVRNPKLGLVAKIKFNFSKINSQISKKIDDYTVGVESDGIEILKRGVTGSNIEVEKKNRDGTSDALFF